MIIQNGIRLEDVIRSLVFFDCFLPEFWRYVNEFYGTNVLNSVDNNEQVTEILQSFFWFDTINGVESDNTANIGYRIEFLVENDVTKFLRIYYDTKILWNLVFEP